MINVGDSVYRAGPPAQRQGSEVRHDAGPDGEGQRRSRHVLADAALRFAQRPHAGAFRTGLQDTTVRRYLQQINPADTTVDSLVVVVGATDGAAAADTAKRTVFIVAGPKVSVVAPNNGDSIPAGVGINVSARAQSGNGVGRIDIRVQGEANWPTKLDTTISQIYSNNPRDVTFSTTARIPFNAPLRGKITVSATSIDVNGSREADRRCLRSFARRTARSRASPRWCRRRLSPRIP